jgi:hypothetical protein
LRRCFFPDDIITIRFCADDDVNDDEEDAAKLSPRGEKEEEVNGTSTTADDILI